MSGKTGKKGPKLPPVMASPKLNAESPNMQNTYEDKLQQLEARFQAQVDTLHRVIEQKDNLISKLSMDIGELKKSMSFVTNETTELKNCIDENKRASETKFNEANKKFSDIKSKTVDLEDRSRRCNLVFFNFEEEEPGTMENCEQKVDDLLTSLNILEGEDAWIDRAHRIGRRRPENANKPRPIIVKFAYYKQKDKIIKSGRKFKECAINVSEDFSKETLLEHSKLRKHGREAKEFRYKDSMKAIKYYKVTYRRLVVTYTTNKNSVTASTFTKSFSLDQIQDNPNWYMPPNDKSSSKTHQ